ncbi:IclR family transcriptional regulator domain-containing protein [Prauserella flavalba]|uniref:IclR family transcriptional regulator n=1 Tax=Prauserella flavalba TaxID=1477506 RepID=A0A318LBV1_9PSEU|nr:IclR family transcriptional regulator C-terminal domain-containing protein [Prauserella flavalba]PXY21525.1 IclR family transcriptional regulator [Prauserella flavalba]
MSDDEKTGQNHIQGLERGLAVLTAFDAERPKPTVAELAAATGLSRPVVRRVLLTLQRLGYVSNLGPRWTLTPRVLSIGQHYTATHALPDLAQPHLMRLADQTDESATLATLDGTEVVYIARVPVRRVLSVTVAPGTRAAAHATSLGRVLLAWESPERIESVLSEAGMPRFTPYTVTDPAEFREILAVVREQGWSMVMNEREEGLLSLSAPVRDHHGTVVAAVASSTSTGRTTPERLREEVLPLLLETAKRISAELGSE